MVVSARGPGESLLRDAWPRWRRFKVSIDDITDRFLVRLRGVTPLKLVKLTSALLKALVKNSEVSTNCSGAKPCTMPQRWSRALHDHPEQVDGLMYMSRHVIDMHAIVVYDLAAHKLGVARSVPLIRASGLMAAIQAQSIDVGA